MGKAGMRQGQSLTEYAVLIAVTAAAIFGMQTYIKRGLQAQFKTRIDANLFLPQDPADFPPECTTANPPITDPMVCAQVAGAGIDDDRPGETIYTQAHTEGLQAKATAYHTVQPGKMETIARSLNGTFTHREGNGSVVTQGFVPPQFVRRGRLPTGYPDSGGGLFPTMSGGAPGPSDRGLPQPPIIGPPETPPVKSPGPGTLQSSGQMPHAAPASPDIPTKGSAKAQ